MQALSYPRSPGDLKPAEAVEAARSMHAAGPSGLAEIYWRDVVFRDPDNSEALLGLGEQLAAGGQSANALVYACRALEAGAQDAPSARLVHQVLLGLCGRPPAISDTSVEQAADGIVQLLNEVDPEHLWPAAVETISGLLLRMGVDEKLVRPDRAAEPFLDPGSIRAPAHLLARYNESRGDAGLPETISGAIERLDISEADAEAWFVLGRDSMARDEIETAQELFRRAAYLEPGRIKYRINLARALAANAQYADAYRAFHSVSALTPSSRADDFHQEEASANRRSLLSRLILVVRQAIAEGDDNRAWSVFRLIEWEEELPDTGGMRAAILRLSIDRVMKAHKSDDPDVIQLARHHLERDPESVYVRQVLGQALMVADRFREAAEIWGSLTVSMPDNARMFLQYAKCLERSGAGEAALEAAERALHHDPELASARIIRDRLSA